MVNTPHILIVDDDDTICRFISDLLENEGYITETVYNGDAALQVIDTFEPDLILLDMMMPMVSGLVF